MEIMLADALFSYYFKKINKTYREAGNRELHFKVTCNEFKR